MTIETTIAVLYAALRIIGIDLTELNLGKNDARQSVKDLFDTLPSEGRNLNRHRNI